MKNYKPLQGLELDAHMRGIARVEASIKGVEDLRDNCKKDMTYMRQNWGDMIERCKGKIKEIASKKRGLRRVQDTVANTNPEIDKLHNDIAFAEKRCADDLSECRAFIQAKEIELSLLKKKLKKLKERIGE